MLDSKESGHIHRRDALTSLAEALDVFYARINCATIDIGLCQEYGFREIFIGERQ